MRVFLLGLAAVAAQGNTENVSSDAETGQTQMVGNTDADGTNAFTNAGLSVDVNGVADDDAEREGTMADPSTWMGLDTLDENSVEVPWGNRDATTFHTAKTDAAEGAGWQELHQQRSYQAIKVKNLYCDGVELMEFELELHDEHGSLTGDRNAQDRINANNNEVKLDKFLCRGEDGEASNADAATWSNASGLEYRAFTADDQSREDSGRYAGNPDSGLNFNGIDGMVSLNPYECDRKENRNLLDSDLSDATTTVKIEFRVVSTNDDKIEFHKYLVEASCEFNKIYNARTAFGTRQRTTAIDTEIFQLLDTDFGMHMSGSSQTEINAGTPTFRANENIEAVIYTNGDTQSRRKWEKLNIKLGYAPIQCKVEQQSSVTDSAAGTAITIFDIARQDAASDNNDRRGGHPALEMQVAASTHLRIWYMKYIAFVMAEDDADGSYELQCALQPCYYDPPTTADNSNVCVLAFELVDVTHEAAPLSITNTWNTMDGSPRTDDNNDWSHLFDHQHED